MIIDVNYFVFYHPYNSAILTKSHLCCFFSLLIQYFGRGIRRIVYLWLIIIVHNRHSIVEGVNGINWGGGVKLMPFIPLMTWKCMLLGIRSKFPLLLFICTSSIMLFLRHFTQVGTWHSWTFRPTHVQLLMM